jgi:hypothetical protein
VGEIAVSIRITGDEMTSDLSRHRADRYTNRTPERWVVSWLPGRRLTRNQAITAMVLAEAVATMQEEGRPSVVDHTHRLWPHIDNWARELDLSGTDAVVRVSEVPEP